MVWCCIWASLVLPSLGALWSGAVSGPVWFCLLLVHYGLVLYLGQSGSAFSWCIMVWCCIWASLVLPSLGALWSGAVSGSFWFCLLLVHYGLVLYLGHSGS